jgi:hypothetical protein
MGTFRTYSILLKIIPFALHTSSVSTDITEQIMPILCIYVYIEFLQNYIYKFSSYLTGNTLRLRYKAQPVNAIGETVSVYCENHTGHTDTLCGRNAVLICRSRWYIV